MINSFPQEDGTFDIVFDLVGFELDLSKLKQSAFITPDVSLLRMTPEDTCWRNRTSLVNAIGSGQRPKTWRARCSSWRRV
jgi:hypothetical protein